MIGIGAVVVAAAVAVGAVAAGILGPRRQRRRLERGRMTPERRDSLDFRTASNTVMGPVEAKRHTSGGPPGTGA